nr:vegetative cell wall protein gp1-like [Aegilops tauschii subsp. strangulata]
MSSPAWLPARGGPAFAPSRPAPARPLRLAPRAPTPTAAPSRLPPRLRISELKPRQHPFCSAPSARPGLRLLRARCRPRRLRGRIPAQPPSTTRPPTAPLRASAGCSAPRPWPPAGFGLPPAPVTLLAGFRPSPPVRAAPAGSACGCCSAAVSRVAPAGCCCRRLLHSRSPTASRVACSALRSALAVASRAPPPQPVSPTAECWVPSRAACYPKKEKIWLGRKGQAKPSKKAKLNKPVDDVNPSEPEQQQLELSHPIAGDIIDDSPPQDHEASIDHMEVEPVISKPPSPAKPAEEKTDDVVVTGFGYTAPGNPTVLSKHSAKEEISVEDKGKWNVDLESYTNFSAQYIHSGYLNRLYTSRDFEAGLDNLMNERYEGDE